jgi:uncharacterized protein (TIGR01244 family)
MSMATGTVVFFDGMFVPPRFVRFEIRLLLGETCGESDIAQNGELDDSTFEAAGLRAGRGGRGIRGPRKRSIQRLESNNRVNRRIEMRVRRSLAVCSVVSSLLLAFAGGIWAQQAAASEPEMPEGWADLVRNPRIPREGVLSGGQPTPEQLAAAKEAGFETVINIRVPGEPGTDSEQELVESFGMAYVSLPVRGATGMTEENARALAAALNEAEQPVLLHCGSGNRIGGLFALMAYHFDDKTVEEALAFGREAGLTRLEPVIRDILETAATDQEP